MTATIILLNGAGSAGKSSIARALQSMLAAPCLHFQMDTFLEMLPDAYHEHPEGFVYETLIEAGEPAVEVRGGPVSARLMRGMRRSAAAMAEEGNDLIVDDVCGYGEIADYRALLAKFTFHTVGVFASLGVLEARERQRGDRMIGLARWQYRRVHEGIDYDFRVDTDAISPVECARLIKDHFGL